LGIQKQLRLLFPLEVRDNSLGKLAQFLSNVAGAWDEANQEQRNKIAKTLFDQILVEDNKVVAVKPRPELEPFFKLNLECHSRDIASDPDGGRLCAFIISDGSLPGRHYLCSKASWQVAAFTTN